MRYDERDIPFSRMSYEPGTPVYDDYYLRNPHLKETDDALRAMPALCSPKTRTYEPLLAPMVDVAFIFLNDIRHLAEGPPMRNEPLSVNTSEITAKIKGLAKYYGAKSVGITPSKSDYFYSHRGRQPEIYGQPVESPEGSLIVFTVEMKKEHIFSAPLMPEVLAVTKGYMEAAVAGMMLAYYIRLLGYEARNHMDGNYLMVLPPVAQAAGLGQLGRHGLLVSPEFGSRVRLGAVSTNLPLDFDEPDDFNLHAFCDVCGKCAATCLSKAIPKGSQTEVDGILRWQVNHNACYAKWRALGTDCGVCLASCPFSDTLSPEDIAALRKDANHADVLLKIHETKYRTRPVQTEREDWMALPLRTSE